MHTKPSCVQTKSSSFCGTSSALLGQQPHPSYLPWVRERNGVRIRGSRCTREAHAVPKKAVFVFVYVLPNLKDHSVMEILDIIGSIVRVDGRVYYE